MNSFIQSKILCLDEEKIHMVKPSKKQDSFDIWVWDHKNYLNVMSRLECYMLSRVSNWIFGFEMGVNANWNGIHDAEKLGLFQVVYVI